MSGTVNPKGLPPRRARVLARRLVEWFRGSARPLPWRRTRDPYAIWISEVMLQQTRVEVVITRYEAFLRRFPDLRSLAAAPETDVLAEWAGLGYYRRARQLHAAARRVVEAHGGRLPTRSAELLLLPGFGRYTAGAVASIAHGEKVGAIDGNVQRVVARLLALEDEPQRRSGAVEIEAVVDALLEESSPRELNEGLMELGATVCTPRRPRCAHCPWGHACEARQSGEPERWPIRRARKPMIGVHSFVAVVRRGESWLWRRRPESGRNAGLWELPSTGFVADPERDETTADVQLVRLGRELGRSWRVGAALARVRHTITHHRVQFVAHAVEETAGAAVGEALWWAPPEEVRPCGWTAATSKLVARLPTLL